MSSSEPIIFRHTGAGDFLGRAVLQAEFAKLEDAEIVILDFTQTEYMDSSAIGQLVGLFRTRTKRGRSAPRIVQGPGVARIFEVAGLASVLPIFDSVEQARNATH